MLDKFKKFKKLRDLQEKLKKETVTVEKSGTEVTMNGQMEIKDLKLNKEKDSETLENDIKDCLNEAMQKIREKVSGSLR